MDCVIEFKYNKIRKTFNSDEELDGWLYDHPGLLHLQTVQGDMQYSMTDAAKETVGKINLAIAERTKLTSARNNNLFLENLGSSPVYVGPTEVFPYMGNPNGALFTSPVVKYNSTQDPELKKFRTGIGNDFEKAFNYVLYSQLYQGEVVKNPVKRDQLIVIADKIKNLIYNTHGKDCTILVQTKIAAKELSGSFLDSVHMSMGQKQDASGNIIPAVKLNYTFSPDKAGNIRTATGADINSFVGNIDLIVIDSAGKAYIYDFKTYSGESLTFDNHPHYGLQIASYRQILKQYDIDVADDCYIIPIKVDYTTKAINPEIGDENISGFSFNPNNWRVALNEANELSRRVSKWFPSKTNISYNEYTEVHTVMEKCFPNASVQAQTRLKESTVEQEFKDKKLLSENDSRYKDGWRYIYYKKGFIGEGEEKFILAKTDDELKRKLSDWIQEYNKRSAETNTLFAKSLKQVMKSGTVQQLKDIASNFNKTRSDYIVAAFSRYIHTGWELISNELMIANGLFLFQNKDIVELVVLSTHNIFNKLHFDHGKTTRPYTTILGNFASDEDGMDSRWVLPNFFGNIELMKGMIFLGQHPEIFKDAKINKVSTLSLLSPGYMEESNQKLCENYNLLAKFYKQTYKEDLGILSTKKEFTTDAKSYINQATDLMKHSQGLKEYLEKPAFEDAENADTKQIIRMIEVLRNKQGEKLYQISKANWQDEDWVALQYLQRALLSKLGYEISPDFRVGTYSDSDVSLNGLYARSFADSKSAIARTLHEATYTWVRTCQNEYIAYTNKWKQAIKELYVESGHSMFWGGEWDFFKPFFKQNNGKLDSRFILKDKGSMQTAKQNKVLELFYDALDRFKYGNKQEAILEAIANGTYGEVPLIKSELNEKISKMNLFKAVGDKLATDYNVFKDFLLGVDISEQRVRELNDIDARVLPTFMFDDEFREQKLLPKNEKDDPTSKYTTDIDFIFNRIVAEGIKRERSPQMLMVSSAIRAVSSYMMSRGMYQEGNEKEFLAAIDDYVKRKIFSMPIIDEGNIRLQKVINIIKGITSITTLAVSTKAFARETLTGIERAFIRVAVRPDLKEKFDIKYYHEALREVIENAYKNADVMSWHMQLNAIYGTSNFSYNEMPRNSTIQQWGLKNLNSSHLFFTATWPDFIHRNSIIIAYLKSIGAYDAYSLEDGILKYDMSKDKRFKTILKYKTLEECPQSDVRRWNEEHNLYKDALDSWIRSGYRKEDGTQLQEGDALPQALSPRDALGLKDIADRMYGNYDDETKSLMRDKLLGSLFLQFRTYGINRLQEFFDGDTFTSDIHMETVTITDENGNVKKLYMVENPDKEAVLNGNALGYVIKAEDEVTLEEIQSGKAVEFRRPVSTHIIGGQVQTIIDLGTTLFLFKNHDEFEKMWNSNPTYRANVYIFLMDTFGMLLLALLVNTLYGKSMEGEFDSVDWFTQWSYNVAIGITQDGPLWSVISSVFGNGAPPMLGILQNYANNVGSVLSGKKNFFYGLANTFGATRELAYLFNAQ